MRPFNPDPITERSRELFGTYMRRHEYEPSMSPFDSELGSYKRDLYGEYRPRYSTIKVATRARVWGVANGMNLVTMTWTLPWYKIINPDYDISIYQYNAFTTGAWTGAPVWRMLINGEKVYPFESMDYVNLTGNNVSLGTLSIKLRLGDHLEVQFQSDNAADGPGENLYININYVSWEP